jgi:hypothetical protein
VARRAAPQLAELMGDRGPDIVNFGQDGSSIRETGIAAPVYLIILQSAVNTVHTSAQDASVAPSNMPMRMDLR